MHRPEQSYLVVKTMQPVIQEVFEQEQQDPVCYNIAERNELVPVKIVKDNQVDPAEQKVYCTVHYHQVEIGNSIFP